MSWGFFVVDRIWFAIQISSIIIIRYVCSFRPTVSRIRLVYDYITQENESLLFEKGRAQERINELTAICERQRSSFAESGRRAKDFERIASAAKQEAKLADKQVD